MRTRRIAAVLVLLGLLTGLGDYPFVDELFAAEHDCATLANPVGQQPAGHHRHATERMALCYTVLASAVASSSPVIEIRHVQGPQVADEGMQPAISLAVERIERPPAASLTG